MGVFRQAVLVLTTAVLISVLPSFFRTSYPVPEIYGAVSPGFEEVAEVFSGHDLDDDDSRSVVPRNSLVLDEFLAIPETAVTFFPAMLQNRRRTSSHNRVKHKSNFSPTKYYQSQSKISFIATNSWRNELPQRRQKFFTFSEIKTGKLYFHSKVLFKLLNGSVESILENFELGWDKSEGGSALQFTISSAAISCNLAWQTFPDAEFFTLQYRTIFSQGKKERKRINKEQPSVEDSVLFDGYSYNLSHYYTIIRGYLSHARFECSGGSNVSRSGLIDFKKPVKEYWPEFGQKGKEKITVEMLMEHECLVRRVDPKNRTLGQFFAEEVADVFVGAPCGSRHHSPGIPAANGVGTARGIAKLFGIMANGGEYDNKTLISRRFLDEYKYDKRELTGDLVLWDMPLRWKYGMHVIPEVGQEMNLFGSAGLGGQIGYADPNKKIGYGFVSRYLSPQGLAFIDPRSKYLQESVLRAVKRLKINDKYIHYI
ncbi:putative beta-lactamase domain-containing protein 2 [Apostichopus japonicus]|uniref:Putative beta-lactamase domain-containing protein 2 n=1 Tax=Stichopus japonicus TaxID=307972 RepID=A0A2G8L879_STIJA|nr:putative beta-lactamase domain-containing protein 2 [Apostichopus japonicus]